MPLASLPRALASWLTDRRADLQKCPEEHLYTLFERYRVTPFEPALSEMLARAALNLNEPSLARGLLSRALELNPHNLKLNLAYMELLAQLQDSATLLAVASRALRQHPHQEELYTLIGYALEREAGYEAALSVYERGAIVSKPRAFAHYLRMRALFKLGRVEEGAARALVHLEQYQNDNNPKAWMLCVSLLEAEHKRLTSKDSDEAREGDIRPQLDQHAHTQATLLKATERALSADPRFKPAHEWLALHHRWRQPKLAYQHALKAYGEGASVELHQLLITLEEARGDHQRARYIAETLKRRHPNVDPQLSPPPHVSSV